MNDKKARGVIEEIEGISELDKSLNRLKEKLEDYDVKSFELIDGEIKTIDSHHGFKTLKTFDSLVNEGMEIKLTLIAKRDKKDL